VWSAVVIAAASEACDAVAASIRQSGRRASPFHAAGRIDELGALVATIGELAVSTSW
jgi:hypothetical protein